MADQYAHLHRSTKPVQATEIMDMNRSNWYFHCLNDPSYLPHFAGLGGLGWPGVCTLQSRGLAISSIGSGPNSNPLG
jgi:hypothetical protein